MVIHGIVIFLDFIKPLNYELNEYLVYAYLLTSKPHKLKCMNLNELVNTGLVILVHYHYFLLNLLY